MSIRRIARPDRLICRLVLPNGRRRCQFDPIYTTNRAGSTNTPIPAKYPDPSIYQALPPLTVVKEAPKFLKQTSTIPTHLKNPDVLVTLYNFPTYQPQELLHYPATHLYLPLRRDIIHRAIVFEGDNERQGTAYTIWRDQHPGSGRKLRPQKGTGRARLGDSSSPMLKGGVKAFGPKRRGPESVATKLPRKIYDQAWRMALSHRYRKGELVIVDKIYRSSMKNMTALETAKQVELFNGAGYSGPSGVEHKKTGTTLWIISRGDTKKGPFMESMRRWFANDRVKYSVDVDVKMLLEGKRIVIERAALEEFLYTHQSDLVPRVDVAKAREIAAKDEELMSAAVAETKAIQEAADQEALEVIRSYTADENEEISTGGQEK
ncbi:ribosomal protein L4 [Microthyrium microscopicum]|uniref:Large ribosomal subunit protein uL4m n=1 Tax=Microthyrium microscopicum TaxID=703497 RepID=A0A6A6UD87_9PEZI|nr:ribosomal protein L4 [Microthyrium microscopicum]